MVKILIIIYPSKINPGTIIRDQVSIVDVLPTVLEMAGIDYKGKYNFQGTSLVKLINGEERKLNSVAYAENWWDSPDAFFEQICLRTNKYKYILTPNPDNIKKNYPAFPDINEELYDLEDDSDELNNIAKNNKNLTKTFNDLISKYLSYSGDIDTLKKNNPAIVNRNLELLKFLGYIK